MYVCVFIVPHKSVQYINYYCDGACGKNRKGRGYFSKTLRVLLRIPPYTPMAESGKRLGPPSEGEPGEDPAASLLEFCAQLDDYTPTVSLLLGVVGVY